MKYDVTDGGSKFFMKFSFLGMVAKSFNADILELSESKFVFQYEDTTSASGIFGGGRKSRRDKSQKGVITVETLVR